MVPHSKDLITQLRGEEEKAKFTIMQTINKTIIQKQPTWVSPPGARTSLSSGSRKVNVWELGP